MANITSDVQHYWKGKRVLITGCDGFIGSHLVEKLLFEEASVMGIVKPVSARNDYVLKNLEAVENRIELICCDLGKKDSIELIKKVKPEIVLHLAALAHVDYSFDHPREVTDSNLIGTLNVLDACLGAKVERVVVTSSSEVYGPALTDSIDETHPLFPTTPYAASKVACDRYAYAYFKTYGLNVSIIRPFNTYGPRHTYDVIPRFIWLALRDQPLTIFGSGKQSRDFT